VGAQPVEDCPAYRRLAQEHDAVPLRLSGQHCKGLRDSLLIVMGVLIWTGELFQLNIEAQRFLDRFGLNFFSEV
jgi:hypothetical protein